MSGCFCVCVMLSTCCVFVCFVDVMPLDWVRDRRGRWSGCRSCDLDPESESKIRHSAVPERPPFGICICPGPRLTVDGEPGCDWTCAAPKSEVPL